MGLILNPYRFAVAVETLIDRTTGTHFGDFGAALGGSLAAIFDGTTSQAHTAGGYAGAANGYAGTTWGAGKIFSKAIVYPSNNFGFAFTDPAAMSIQIYGKNGTPSNGTDGTIIGTSGAFADGTSAKTINSTDITNAYTSIWAYVNPGEGSNTYCAELEMWELI
jgi:hypothetical protein